MSFINYSSREINCKIVYYGPGLCGKTTNLQYVYTKTNPEARGKMISLATETERTLFFDFLPLSLGEIRGFKTRFHLYTVPGQVFYDASRKLILKGVDGVCFVADSQSERMEANIESLDNLQTNLEEQGFELEKLPFVMQYNKRNLPSASTIEELRANLNPRNVPEFEAVAATGVGVFDTLKAVAKLVLTELRKGGLAVATLKLRGDLKATESTDAGLTFFDVSDPRSGATLRMYEHEWKLARRLDGAASYEEVASWAAGPGQLGWKPSAGDVAGYARSLADLGFFDEPESVRRLPLHESGDVVSGRDESSFADLNSGRLSPHGLERNAAQTPSVVVDDTEHGAATTVPGAPAPAVLAELRAAQEAAARADAPPPPPPPPPRAVTPVSSPPPLRAPPPPARAPVAPPAVAARPPRAASSRGGLMGALVLALVLVFAAAVYFAFISPAFAPAHVRAQAVAPSRDIVRYADSRGTVHQGAPTVLSFGTEGRVVDIVAPGTEVTAGKTLATLDIYDDLQKGLADVRDRETFYESAVKAAEAKGKRSAMKSAQAKVDEKKELRLEIEAKMAEARIVVETTGTVAEVMAAAGTDVVASAPVLKLVDRRLLADVKVAAGEASLFTPGATLSATGADGKQTIPLRVLTVEGDLAHLQLGDGATDVKTGSEIRIVKSRVPNVTPLPKDAVVKSQGGVDQVFVFTGEIVRARPVTVVERSATEVLVTGGVLSPTDRVVIAPPPTLQDGQKATTAP